VQYLDDELAYGCKNSSSDATYDNAYIQKHSVRQVFAIPIAVLIMHTNGPPNRPEETNSMQHHCSVSVVQVRSREYRGALWKNIGGRNLVPFWGYGEYGTGSASL